MNPVAGLFAGLQKPVSVWVIRSLFTLITIAAFILEFKSRVALPMELAPLQLRLVILLLDKLLPLIWCLRGLW